MSSFTPQRSDPSLIYLLAQSRSRRIPFDNSSHLFWCSEGVSPEFGCCLVLFLPDFSKKLHQIRVCASPRGLHCTCSNGLEMARAATRISSDQGRCSPISHQSLFLHIDFYPALLSASNHWLLAKRGWQRFLCSAYGWEVIFLPSPAGSVSWQLRGMGAEMALFCSISVLSPNGPLGPSWELKGFTQGRGCHFDKHYPLEAYSFKSLRPLTSWCPSLPLLSYWLK